MLTVTKGKKESSFRLLPSVFFSPLPAPSVEIGSTQTHRPSKNEMADLFRVITRFSQSFLEVNTISIDNWTFKCYYKISVVLAVFCSVIVTSRQFFGSPIKCDAGSAEDAVSKDVLESYCWMYASFDIPLSYKGVCSGKDQNDGIDGSIMYNSYYQWIPIYLVSLSVVFYLPRCLWMMMEGGLMKYFGKGTRNRTIEDSIEKRDRLVSYFCTDIHNKYDVYYYGFVFCEFLNFLILILVFSLTNVFLNYRYKYYGFRVIYYYLLPPEEQKKFAVNPMCYTFPRISSCDYYRFGTGGENSKINTQSLLQNNNKNSEKIEDFISKCPIGDWFILYQLSKNINRKFFMDFLQSVVRKVDPEQMRDDTGDNIMEMMLKPSYKSQDSDPRKAEEGEENGRSVSSVFGISSSDEEDNKMGDSKDRPNSPRHKRIQSTRNDSGKHLSPAYTQRKRSKSIY
ncbi:inx [Lepeophtheirus salmonis]|uniref:Innexin n=1 Tax=Lepeophtheirus salmonis TaxID=72036 RepID=A0A7R8CCS4_LEPSM|nr:inx [Lepeophtheirus salmonis]CAF2768683.1 inx [Lepeophtheirus salmonis]